MILLNIAYTIQYSRLHSAIIIHLLDPSNLTIKFINKTDADLLLIMQPFLLCTLNGKLVPISTIDWFD